MATPVLDKASVDDRTLAVLRRRDPEIEQVLGHAAHITMYVMAVDQQKWERRNVEGTLYVLKRRTSPRFQILVLNKLSTENYTEPIESGFHSELNAPYLIYTQGGGKVHGIWFYEDSDLHKIAALLTKIEGSLPKLPAAPATPQESYDGEAANGEVHDDGAFWDKPAAKQPQQPAQPEQAPPLPPAAGGNALDSLFKNAQAKQQQAPARPAAAAPAAVVGSAPLPPSFFLQQQQQQQDASQRSAAAHPPAGPAPAAAPAAEQQPTNPLQRLFSKGPASQPSLPLPQQQPAAQQAPLLPPAPPAAPPTTTHIQPPPSNANVLNALFTGAAQRAHSLQPPPLQAPGAMQQHPQLQSPQPPPPPAAAKAAAAAPLPPPPAPPAQQPAPHIPSHVAGGPGAAAGGGPASISSSPRAAPVLSAHQQQQLLRAALAKLVQRDEFVAMLSEELHNVGLLR